MPSRALASRSQNTLRRVARAQRWPLCSVRRLQHFCACSLACSLASEGAAAVSRHWAIGLRTGETRRVSGPGVVGKFPVFSTHSFIHVEPNPRSRLHLTESAEGEEFVYQSCTGQDELTTSFGGRLTFRLVPPEELAGDHIAFNNIPIDRGLGLFDVDVKSFPIDRYEDVEDNWVL